jgi:hypothetical protein
MAGGAATLVAARRFVQMLMPRPPRKQRLIRKHYRQDWFKVVCGLIDQGKTLEQIASQFTADGIPVSAASISIWMKARCELDRVEAATV